MPTAAEQMTGSKRQLDIHSNDDSIDRQLLARIATKDRDAFAELYVSYQPRLFKFIFRLIRTYDIAEEIVNDVMMAVWKGASSYRGEAKVSTWVFGIAYRQTMRRLSKKSLKLVSDYDLESIGDADARNLEREDWVRAGIDALPAAQKAAVMLVFYLGLSLKEAATIADCPVNTIKTRMFHARRKLKATLETVAEPTATS